jgi:hypothetical protein
MKRLLLLLLFTLPVEAQVCPGASVMDEAYAEEALVISSTALPFTAAVYAPAGTPQVKYASVTLETNPIRVSVTGVVPTATVGQLFTNSTNVSFFVCGNINVRKFLAIRTGADAAITAIFYR